MIRKDFNNADHWSPLKSPIDVAYLGGHQTPGLCEIAGASSPRKWDEREGYALSGAVIVYHGLGLSHFEVRLRLYDDDDWEDWHRFRPVVERLPRAFTGSRGAIDIVHPITAHLGIKAICIEDILQPEQTDNGEWTVVLKVIEFRVPVFSVAKAKGAQATPADPEDARLESLSGQLKDHGIDFLGNAALDALAAESQP